MSKTFIEAVNKVNLQKNTLIVSNDIQAKLYGLYKRVTVGLCSEHGGERPGILRVYARTKYDSWKLYDEYTVEQSEKMYIDTVSTILD